MEDEQGERGGIAPFLDINLGVCDLNQSAHTPPPRLIWREAYAYRALVREHALPGRRLMAKHRFAAAMPPSLRRCALGRLACAGARWSRNRPRLRVAQT